MATSKYINPFTDFGFKKIFGEEENKDILIDFLNTILPDEDKIYDLTYKSSEKLSSHETDRKAIFDLYCENEKGEKFIVELQRAHQTFFKDRTVYYSTFPIQEQATKGQPEGKGWKYELKAVYVVSLMDFTFDQSADFHHVVELKNQRNEVFYDKLKFIYLELPKFKKSEQELSNHFDKWIYILNRLESFTEAPKFYQEYIFKRVFEITEYTALAKEEQMRYEEDLKIFRDYLNTLDTAEAKGREEGRKEGVLEGERRKAIETAKSMLSDGLPPEKISIYTGLTVEEISQLK
ncbi:Rpn family recombination-promoting nuclease/putative transposase [Flammeovirga yaeyamensis]|uniref:Rpn family recombination-promoting nuclease/putative transposase n=1 Tax=Flammeovirga yaeyamensis TaxID=367791 RepID=A0AAX1NCL5_9BACT|nr:Rpn family recombination-promoting nuclease/putative transposase [Flammeovirga yaeyamensis]MBB3696846.1 putative transposase/invertase (TIGR01784 family) [Flammeovirga yaeyamensis]NMF33512.1 PD-(D/E)XK nuclease family transposase [Flammeovirga yaeyamensis]QWG05217.1 Rpn family recombination-promoting nuclease/putative transposase [Flammeovirga yaeyamensis]